MSKVVSKALDILSSFSVSQPALRPDELARISKIPLSTIYRFLNGLLAGGYLTKDSTSQGYRLGSAMLRLARVAEAGLDFRDLAIPWMNRLFELTGETIYLVIRHDVFWMCLENRVPESVGVRVLMSPGETAPIYAGVPGKVLLAHLSDGDLHCLLKRIRLVKITPRTVTDRRKLREQLADIRARGYCYGEEEYVPGSWGLGAPLLSKDGLGAAALVITGVLGRKRKPSRLPAYTKILLQATRSISAELGYDSLSSRDSSRTSARPHGGRAKVADWRRGKG